LLAITGWVSAGFGRASSCIGDGSRDCPELLEVDSGVRPADIYDQLLGGEEVAA